MSKTIGTIERRIAKIKKDLTALGELRPGNLSEQYTVCGKAGCRCQGDPPQRHGPYFQLAWSRKGKSTTRFVRRSELPAVRAQLENYARMQQLLEQWVELSIELCELRRKEVREGDAR